MAGNPIDQDIPNFQHTRRQITVYSGVVHFTVPLAMLDPAYMIPMAQAAEEAGFHSVALADSLAYPRTSDSTYPYNRDGSRTFLENKPFIEPLVAAAAIGAATTTLHAYTFVLKLPIRNPVVLAKEATSVSALTGGRLELGVGISPWPDDYELCGVPWAGRGRRFEECIEILRGLGTGEYYEHHGEFYDFPAVKLKPGAAVPILIGGHSERSLDRAARLGDGWLPAGMADDELARCIHQIMERRRHYGRDGLPFSVYAASADGFSPDGVRRLADLGVTHVTGGMSGFDPYGLAEDHESLQDKIDALRRYADKVISPVNA
jgi:probable F420-dependent oxidoreductase